MNSPSYEELAKIYKISYGPKYQETIFDPVAISLNSLLYRKVKNDGLEEGYHPILPAP